MNSPVAFLTHPESMTESQRLVSRAREDLVLLADLYRRVPGLDATWTPYCRLPRRRRRCPSLWAHLKTWARRRRTHATF